ncbi:CBM_collapsed_G0026460.mRNA.1.CDS.1 [Saccharomyces cerevisiae]|nr:CBM_collapsed_G0026460.mRNA.1.CDS.1 [Saccharomyces cerevisiae]
MKPSTAAHLGPWQLSRKRYLMQLYMMWVVGMAHCIVPIEAPVADHQPGKKQDAAISQISDGQIQATASGPETTAATTPSSTANVSVYEGAGMKVESKNMGYIVGVAALLFL